MDSTVIQQVWEAEQNILDVVHNICKYQHIRYSLFYGTLIGAVRHKGFIPWDDDIDLVMPRDDYEKFTRYWKENPVEGYIFQDYNTNSDYTNNFIKIRKDHTTFLQTEEERNVSYQTGVFIDIFPADRLAPTIIGRKIQYAASAVNLLYTRGYTSGDGGIVGLAEVVLLKVPRKMQLILRNSSEKIIKHWNHSAKTQYYCAATIQECKDYYPADMFDKLKYIEFNGKKYFSAVDTDSVLKVEYGDYMKLPPEEERVWKHHPIIIDFSHNYEEL